MVKPAYPSNVEHKGSQPKPQSGHQPTTGQGGSGSGPGAPPNQGSGGKK